MTNKVTFRNHIDIENAVVKNQKRDIGEHVLYYKLKEYKYKGYLIYQMT